MKLTTLFVLISILSFGQSFDSFNKDDDGPKVIWKSTTGKKEKYFIAFYDDGTIVHQSNEYDYIDDRRINNTFSSAQGFIELLTDMKEVSKNKETIINNRYAIEKAAFGSVKLKIKDIPKTFTFSKYAIKQFQKSLNKS